MDRLRSRRQTSPAGNLEGCSSSIRANDNAPTILQAVVNFVYQHAAYAYARVLAMPMHTYIEHAHKHILGCIVCCYVPCSQMIKLEQ